MNFNTYWFKLERATPALKQEGKMTISIASFKKQIEKAYRAGQLESYTNQGKPVAEGFTELFDTLRGVNP